MTNRRMYAPQTVVVPTGPDRFELRGPTGTVVVGRFHLRLLGAFERGATIDDVLSDHLSDPEGTLDMLSSCEAAGVLVPIASNEDLVWPDRHPVFETMFGVPNFEPNHPAGFVFLGVPYDGGTTNEPGARHGPRAIRAGSDSMHFDVNPRTLSPTGFFDQAHQRTVLEGVWLADAGDVVLPPGTTSHDAERRVRGAVLELLSSGAIPVVLGGDHSITFAALSAYPDAPIGVIQLDAHTDLGSVDLDRIHHGNVFRAVLDRFEHVECVVQAGLRGYLSGAEDQSHERAVTVGLPDIEDGDASQILAAAPEELPYYLSIDIDVVDPAYAPATGTPVAGGLTPRALDRLVRAIAASRRIVGIDITEVAAPAGPRDITGQLAATTLLTAMAGVAARLRSTVEPVESDG